MSLKLVEQLYKGFESHDPQTMLAVLHPEFVLRVSDGMPLGVGGEHHGPQAAMRDCWGVIFGAYDTAPVPEDYVWEGTERCVVLGHYRGTVREAGTPFEAAFAHVLTVRDGRIATLTQITDTARWTP
ncbi:nuclear transport factor 2 family protein [Nonomuraea sp. NPDC050556]|uniref:nuclear transport factor 2 family protein n=1 Tax=Nonomuraea sp. NPDC050556 TaxID=3364369 RepID=UPI0037AABD27